MNNNQNSQSIWRRAMTRSIAIFSLAIAISLPALATDFYWVGGTSGSPWTTLTNWNTSSDGTGDTPTEALGADDTAIFTANGNVSIDANLTIESNIDVASTATVSFSWTASCDLTIEGDLSGEGNLYFYHRNKNNASVYLKGSNENFKGKFQRYNTVYHAKLKFDTGSATSADADWALTYKDDTSQFVKSGTSDDSLETYYFGSVTDSNYNYLYGYDARYICVEIGNRDSVASEITGSIGSSVDNHNCICKVGSNILKTYVENVYKIILEGGTLDIASEGAIPDQPIEINGDNTVLATSAGVDFSGKISWTTEKTLNFSTTVATTWATPIPETQRDFVKWGSGTLTLSQAPLQSGTFTIKQGSVKVPDNATVNNLEVDDGGSFDARKVTLTGTVSILSGGSVTINVDDDVSGWDIKSGATIIIDTSSCSYTSAYIGTKVATLPVNATNVNVTFSDAPEYLAAKVNANGDVVVAYDSDVYVWDGSANDKLWENVENWTVDGATPLVPPTSDDYAIIPASFASGVEIDQTNATKPAYAATLYLAAPLKFTGPGTTSSQRVAVKTFTGIGTLTFNGAYFYSLMSDGTTKKTLTFDAPIYVESEVTTQIKTETSWVYIRGKVTGSGTIHCNHSGGTSRYSFDGDLTEFNGKITKSTANNAITYFANGNATSALAQWDVGYRNDYGTQFKTSGTDIDNYEVYKFGSFATYSNLYGADAKYVAVEIGGRNEDCSVAGSLASDAATQYNKIVKKGTALLTSTATGVYGVEIQGGAMKIGANTALSSEYIAFKDTDSTAVLKLDSAVTADPSGLFKYSNGAIVFDDEGTSREWASSIDASNTAGFTKRGSGTLTLSAVPNHCGGTRIEGGSLVVSDTAPFDVTTVTLAVADLEGAVSAGTVLLTVKNPANAYALPSVDDRYYVICNTEGEGDGLVYTYKLGKVLKTFDIVVADGESATTITSHGLNTWLEGLEYDLDADATLTALTTDNGHGIRGIDAYLLGYANISDAMPVLSASAADGEIAFSFAGTTPRSIEGISVAYEVQSRNSTSGEWTENSHGIQTTSGVMLPIGNAGLYNRLVATITAEPAGE